METLTRTPKGYNGIFSLPCMPAMYTPKIEQWLKSNGVDAPKAEPWMHILIRTYVSSVGISQDGTWFWGAKHHMAKYKIFDGLSGSKNVQWSFCIYVWDTRQIVKHIIVNGPMRTSLSELGWRMANDNGEPLKGMNDQDQVWYGFGKQIYEQKGTGMY